MHIDTSQKQQKNCTKLHFQPTRKRSYGVAMTPNTSDTTSINLSPSVACPTLNSKALSETATASQHSSSSLSSFTNKTRNSYSTYSFTQGRAARLRSHKGKEYPAENVRTLTSNPEANGHVLQDKERFSRSEGTSPAQNDILQSRIHSINRQVSEVLSLRDKDHKKVLSKRIKVRDYRQDLNARTKAMRSV